MSSRISAGGMWDQSELRAHGAHIRPTSELALARFVSEAQRLRRSGVRLYRRGDGSPAYNFSQVVWLYPAVGMDWTSRLSRQAETLAANILIRFLPRGGRYRVLARICLKNPRVRSAGLAWQFARQVLVSLPREGSDLEADFVREWLQVHLEILHGHHMEPGKTNGAGLRRLSRRALPRGAWMSPGQVLD
jgi:hypothetical protein